MASAHDDDASKSPDDTPCDEQRRAPRFSMEEIKRRRRNGQKTRSLSDIIDKAFVEHAETLRRLGE
ncbi:hypothetical protein [Stappia sp. TSB10GB4]|uniref:hypothetical protein n=1 Tax=Stappia sp. TSB10GB4 TaxID=2003584 RepID=UPI00164426A9|nr:hypothetical protein [Stappia sp. TSB10GB4]